MTLLLGPSDADHFRVRIGRYGDRFYTDPLPSCPIAEASGWHGPSVSTTKPPFANKYVPMRSIADMSSSDWARLAKEQPDARYEAIKSHDKLAGRVNMDRGSIVHAWAEDRLLGRVPLFVEPSRWAAGALEQAERFRPALDAFFDTYQPELVACEVVCIHRDLNDVGYGGTADAFVRIEGDIWAVDWKSRNSDHAAYPEEAAQGGAYIGAQYMIVTGPDGNPQRAKLPAVAGVLIVSIRPDGFKAYPIEAAGAISHYADMHAWWVAQQRLTEDKVIGRPWAPKIAAAEATGAQTQPLPPPQDRRAALRERYALLADIDKLRFQDLLPDPDDLDAVEQALNTVDAFANTVVPPETVTDTPRTPVQPSEDPDGPVVPLAQRSALNARYKKLDQFRKMFVDDYRATMPEVKTTPDGQPRLRPFLIVQAVVTWAETNASTITFDDIALAVGDGKPLAELTLEEAQRLNEAAAALAAA